MSAEILTKVQVFLHEALNGQDGKVEMPSQLIEEFKEACGNALEKQFTQRKKRIQNTNVWNRSSFMPAKTG